MTHVRVNFHCRVIIHVRMHVNFTRGNKIYRGKDARKKKVESRSTFKFTRDFPYIDSILFTRVKLLKFACVRTCKLRVSVNRP